MSREGEFATQIDTQSKERAGELAKMRESHLEEIRLKGEEEEKRVQEMRNEEQTRLEQLQREKEEEIQR